MFDFSILNEEFARKCMNICNLFENCRRDQLFTKGNLLEYVFAETSGGDQYSDSSLSDVNVDGVNISCKFKSLKIRELRNGNLGSSMTDIIINNLVSDSDDVCFKSKNKDNDLYLICSVIQVDTEECKTVKLTVCDKGIEQYFQKAPKNTHVKLKFDPLTNETTMEGVRFSLSQHVVHEVEFDFLCGGKRFSESKKMQIQRDIFDYYLCEC